MNQGEDLTYRLAFSLSLSLTHSLYVFFFTPPRPSKAQFLELIPFGKNKSPPDSQYVTI